MFKDWVQILVEKSEALRDTSAPDSTDAITTMRQICTQLLIEVARADSAISEEEKSTIAETIARRSNLSKTEIADLLTSSAEEVEASISFHRHVREINENFDKAKKIELMEQMWEVAYADNHLDEYEEAFIRQIAELIHVKHRDFVKAKLKVTGQ